MYSVVLMMALSGGTETPDFGHRRSCCSGGYGGCYSSCYSSCSGGRGHGHRRRGHGCHGGGYCSGGYGGCYGGGYCSGGYGGCYGGGYGGCYGGGFGGCYGGGYGGCNGGFGGCYGGGYGGCYGGGVVVGGQPATQPATPPNGNKDGEKDGKEPEKLKEPAKGGALQAPAVILVNLPAEARLLVDGTVTTSTSTQRRLVSPALPTGREFHYTLTAEILRNGQTVRESRPVTVRAGQETRVEFNFAEPAVTASR